MNAVILAATHDRARNSKDIEVPRSLLDLGEDPLLTILVKRLSGLSDIRTIHIVTNEAIKPELEEWATGLPEGLARIDLISDGTVLREESKGAVGDLIFTITERSIDDDLLVIGGDNWFTYDIQAFVNQSRHRSPAVVVTAYKTGWRTSRLGVAEVDEEGRIIQFLEKPKSSTLSLKASCVYFFAARDLKWLDIFAKEQSTVCTPGTFFAWLVQRTTVYGVQMKGTWYDISPSRTMKGPYFLRFRDILSRAVSITGSTWQRAAARELQWANSHEDLLEVLDDEDPNRRIVAAQVVGQTGDLTSEEGKAQIIKKLLCLLSDTDFNQYQYGGFQSDEDSITYVSVTAAESLRQLGYAENIGAVFEKARMEGYKVEDHRNKT